MRSDSSAGPDAAVLVRADLVDDQQLERLEQLETRVGDPGPKRSGRPASGATWGPPSATGLRGPSPAFSADLTGELLAAERAFERRESSRVVRRRLYQKAASSNRRAKVRGNGGSFTAREWSELVESYDGLCGYCLGAPAEEADHVMPVSLGGSSFISNIMPACFRCNRSKGARLDGSARVWS